MIHSWLQLKIAARREEAQQICSFELVDAQGARCRRSRLAHTSMCRSVLD